MNAGRRRLFVGLAGFFTGCSCSPVIITPPRVPEGGRALSIAVTSNNEQRLFVASETGGLFRTFNGGKSWQHLGGLPNYQTVDVAVASFAPNTVIATARSRYRTINDGGIWRSTDGGGTWQQPPGWAPAPGPNCPSRPSAFGISHMPLTRTFHVGTDCGISVSNDDGATWSHFVLDSTAIGFDSLQHRVRSLLIIDRTSGVAAADGGIFFLTPAGAWSAAAIAATPGRVPVPHAFASPHLSGARSIFFHASGGDQKIFVSMDNGASWSAVPAPSVNNREAFVRIGRSVSGDNSKFDVYMGDGQEFHRQSFTVTGAIGTGSWTKLATDHVDPSDVAFDLEQRVPILLASDGGVHVTTNAGASWTMTGAGYDGFNALQIAEVTGQAVTGPSPHLDLYYATQDNGIKASPDGGLTWPGIGGSEGRHLRTDPTSVDHQGTRVTGGRSDSPNNYQAKPHFEQVSAWPSAPVGNEPDGSEAPFLITEDAYVQPAFNTQVTPPSFDYFLTMSAGAAWSAAFTLPLQPKGSPIIAGSPSNPTVYQGVFRAGSFDGGSRFGLMRASNLAGTASVRRADSLGMGAIGSLRTPIARYIVFGVNPRNQDHLIAPDIEAEEMKFSNDGGVSWFPMPALTQAVTDTGRFLFHLSDESLASVIQWDPYDSCRILVGTIQNGIIQSTDGGRTWARIDGTTPVTFISSFFFPPTGDIWISTNGRGLWRLRVTRPVTNNPARCAFPAPPSTGFPVDTTIVVNPATGAAASFGGLGDSIVCPKCTVVGVRGGWVTDFQIAADSLREIAISGGAIWYIDRTGREVTPTLRNNYRAGDGRFADRPVGRGITARRRVRALVLEGHRLRALIAAREDVSLGPSRTPTVFAYSVAPGARSLVFSGEMIRITGSQFIPPARSGQPARIFFADAVVAQNVAIRADGTFTVDIVVNRPRGEVVVMVEQQDGPRTTRARATFDIVVAEPTQLPRQRP